MKQEIDQLEQGLKYPSMSLDFASEISTNKLKGKISPSSRKIKIPKTAKQINDKSKKDKDLEGRKSCCCLI